MGESIYPLTTPSLRSLQRVLGAIFSLLPGKPRQKDIDELLESATWIEIADPAKTGPSAVLATFVADDIRVIKDLLKIEQGSSPIWGAKVEGLRLRVFRDDRLLGEIKYFLGSISIPRWNSKVVLEKDSGFLEWLGTKGVILPCSRLLPEWEAIVDQIHPGLSAEQVLSMVAEAKARIEQEEREQN